MLYRILNENKWPGKIYHILWDVNGTITTYGDIPDPEVCESIFALAKRGVHHSFITGRDSLWLQKFIVFLSQLGEFDKVAENFHFYPELGLMKLDPISGKTEVSDLIKNHPIIDPKIRQNIAGLFYQGKNLIPYQGEKRPGYSAGGDADGNFFLVPEIPAVKFPHFFWSVSKKLIGTAEVIRNPDGSLNQECADRINESAEKSTRVFRDWGLGDSIEVSPVGTALNLVPIIGGYSLDKDVAAGIAIRDLAQELEVSVHEICAQTIAIGDGSADLKFANPVLGLIAMCFVGRKDQLTPTKLQEGQIVLLGEGAIEEGKAVGPKVTKEVLRLIESKIPPKREVVYLKGKDSLEEFTGEARLRRGIEKRIRHFLPTEDVHIHDAFLDPGLQEGHVHTAGYEAIMLEEGQVDALVWADEQIRTYPLTDWGDVIVFLPGTKHTLVVKKPSRVIVAKAHTAIFGPDRRQRVEMPGGIEPLRQQTLDGKLPIERMLVLVEAEKLKS